MSNCHRIGVLATDNCFPRDNLVLGNCMTCTDSLGLLARVNLVVILFIGWWKGRLELSLLLTTVVILGVVS
jgi:hypothetical protein